MAAYDVLFVPPFFTFAVSDESHLLTFSMMFGVGILVSELQRRARLREAEMEAAVLRARTASHAGKVLTHRQLLAEVWGPGHGSQTHYLRVYAAALRRKLEADPTRPRMLLTEAGVGYRLREG